MENKKHLTQPSILAGYLLHNVFNEKLYNDIVTAIINNLYSREADQLIVNINYFIECMKLADDVMNTNYAVENIFFNCELLGKELNKLFNKQWLGK